MSRQHELRRDGLDAVDGRDRVAHTRKCLDLVALAAALLLVLGVRLNARDK